MEKISENTPRRRGRPRIFTATQMSEVDTILGKRATPRHKANCLYKLRAIHYVADDPRFEWLMSDGVTIMRGEGHMRHTILGELGRIDNEQDLEAMALYLCDMKPTAREAIRVMRRFRQQGVAPGSVPQLADEHLADVLRRAINTYIGKHAGLTWHDVHAALAEIRDDIEAIEFDPNCRIFASSQLPELTRHSPFES